MTPNISTIISQTLNIEASRIAPGALLDEDLGADLLDLMSIANAAEGEFLIEIPDADISSWKTVDCITRSVGRVMA